MRIPKVGRLDGIDVLMKGHAALRAELATLTAPLERSHGVGWDDRVALDKERLFRDALEFFTAVKRHEAAEDEFLLKITRPDLDTGLRAAFSEGWKPLGGVMKLFGAVVSTCDGEHVHSVRSVLSRLREKLEARLTYEEKVLFPRLRAGLRACR